MFRRMARKESHLHPSQLLTLFTQAQTILAYFSFRQEPHLSSFTAPNTAGISVVVENPLAHLEARRETSGAMAFFEPCLTPHHRSSCSRFNPCSIYRLRRRYRLGYGGGYYDRLLSSEEWASKPTIGTICCLQSCLLNPWDKPLQDVCTGNRFQDDTLKKLLAN